MKPKLFNIYNQELRHRGYPLNQRLDRSSFTDPIRNVALYLFSGTERLKKFQIAHLDIGISMNYWNDEDDGRRAKHDIAWFACC